MLIDATRRAMNDHECEKDFLATEDTSIFCRFYDEFGESLIINSVPDTDYRGGWLNENYEKESSKAELRDKIGVQYLINLMLLADCSCYVGGMTGGTAVVMLMENRFKDIHIFDLGIYE